jgi:hypothetical protein
MCSNKSPDPVRGIKRYVLAVPQACAELAVVDGLPAESRFRHPRLSTEKLDFSKQGFSRAAHESLCSKVGCASFLSACKIPR